MGRNGTGVKKASDSSIQIQFEYKGVTCRERIKGKPTAHNLNRVTQFKRSIEDAIANGTFNYADTFPNSKRAKQFDEKTRLTLGKWLETWLDRKQGHIKTSVYIDYVKTVKLLKSNLGHIELDALKKRHIREFCEDQTCGNKRIANILSPLRTALKAAVDDEIIEINVLTDFSFKRMEGVKNSSIDPFTKDEQAAILNALKGQQKNLIQFAFWSGMRTSEMVALEWGDIDFIKGAISVQRAETQYANKPETTKTKSGVREIKLLAPALDALNAQKAHTFLEGYRIFHNPNSNTPWTGDQPIRKFWVYALKRAGVRYRRPYNTRHTFASMHLSAGEPLAWVSCQLGHSSVLMTANAYATWIPNSVPDAGNKAVEIFSNINLTHHGK